MSTDSNKNTTYKIFVLDEGNESQFISFIAKIDQSGGFLDAEDVVVETCLQECSIPVNEMLIKQHENKPLNEILDAIIESFEIHSVSTSALIGVNTRCKTPDEMNTPNNGAVCFYDPAGGLISM